MKKLNWVSGCKDFKWVYFVSRRISHIDKKSRTASTSYLASIGICLGVMALIVVMSVMNGFQRSFIDSILDISSYHIQVSKVEEFSFEPWCEEKKSVICSVPFYEAKGLMVGSSGKQSAALVRAVPIDIMEKDKGFSKEVKLISGSFDLSPHDSIVIGSTLAYNLNARVGSEINIVALSGSSDTSLISSNRKFIVKGIFHSGYSEINSSYSFINIDGAKTYFGSSSEKKYGIKLVSESKDSLFLQDFYKDFPSSKAISWREYNRSFFGVLRMEKNALFLIVLLIFVVVAVNIFNSIRRLVFERKEEIAVLSALGSSKKNVRSIFVLQGFFTGFSGSFLGVLLGVLLSLNISIVFSLMAKVEFFFEYFSTRIFRPGFEAFVTENPMFSVYARIPARIFPWEVFLIFLFGVFSSLISCFLASRDILKMNVSEVLKNE